MDNKLEMKNKLAFGLVASIILLFILMMNCSSSEMSTIDQHSADATSGITQDILAQFSNKQFLLINGNDITVADAEVLNDIYKQAAINAASVGTAAAAELRDEVTRLNNEITDANNNIESYKGLIGPGPNTVLGMPKNNYGEELSGDTTDGQRPEPRVPGVSQIKQWGSHGILGDLYRYRKRTPNGRSQESWGTHWGSVNGQEYPRECGVPSPSCSMIHAQGTPHPNNGGNWSWERIKLRSEEERPSWHN
tara:strand:+ start:264 stop:1013 length:750 start_codon:yes stop_codon:yes gene_type:complete